MMDDEVFDEFDDENACRYGVAVVVMWRVMT